MAQRLTREQSKAQTRERLLVAAQEVFTSRGLFAASLEQVAERAGFSIGAIYSNFDSKADLFLALFEEHIARQMDDYMAIVAEQDDPAEQARAAADRWMRYLREHPDYFPLFLEFAAYAARNPQLMPPLAARLDVLHAGFARIVSDAATARGIAVPAAQARQLGVVIDALAIGLALARLADPESVPDELFGATLALLFGALTRSRARDLDAG